MSRNLYFKHELLDQYEDFLNECYEPVSICGCLYDAGRAYKLVDELTFEIDANIYVDENYITLEYDDLTESEIADNYLSPNQTVYCRKED